MTLSSIGIGSKLDLAGLLQSLTDAESKPLVDIQTRAASYTTKLSAYAKVQSALNTFKTAADKLADPAFFQTVKAAVGDPDVLSVTTTSKAVAGNYDIDVTQLAQSQSLVSAGQAKSDVAIGSGTIKIQFGTIGGGTLDSATGQYSGAAFTADGDRAAVEIKIDPKNNTLEGIRDSINKANAGVVATVVNDGSGTPYRLVLTSKESGAESSMQISATGDAALQNLVGYDPAGAQSMRQTTVGQDAKFVVNNVEMTRSSNTVVDAVQGTTMNLSEVGKTSVKMVVDTSSVASAVSAFVKSYNDLLSTATSLSSYDVDNDKAQPLTGDQTLRNLQTRIRQTLSAAQPGIAGSDINVLSEVGVSFQKDGTLAVDDTKLNNALATDMKGVAALFSSGSTEKTGVGKQVSALITDLTSSGGALTAATNGVNATLDDLTDQYNAMSDRVNATIERYRQQFTDLDVLVSSMNNTMTYLTQQFDAMNASAGK